MSRSDGGPERRRAGRRTPAVGETLSHVRLRAGRELAVVDVSDVGLMTEGTMRLLPGTHVGIHLMTRHGRLLVRGRVVRAFVCGVSPEGIRYRGALSFDRSIDTAPGYGIPAASIGPPGDPGNAYPGAGASAPWPHRR